MESLIDGGRTNQREAALRKKPKLPGLKFPLSKILPIKVPLGLDLSDTFAFLKISHKKMETPIYEIELRTAH